MKKTARIVCCRLLAIAIFSLFEQDDGVYCRRLGENTERESSSASCNLVDIGMDQIYSLRLQLLFLVVGNRSCELLRIIASREAALTNYE